MVADEKIIVRVRNYLNEGLIKTKAKAEFMDFFIGNSVKSFDCARLLLMVSQDRNLQNELGFPSFDGCLWVINSCYYSMFYMVRALFEKNMIKLNAESSIHSITFDAFVYFFLFTRKLEKSLIVNYAEAAEDASGLLGKDIARQLVDDYFYEKGKRARFTYNTGEVAMESKAKTSIQRAHRFNLEIQKLIKRA